MGTKRTGLSSDLRCRDYTLSKRGDREPMTGTIPLKVATPGPIRK
jgi:hypothetical protein